MRIKKRGTGNHLFKVPILCVGEVSKSAVLRFIRSLRLDCIVILIGFVGYDEFVHRACVDNRVKCLILPPDFKNDGYAARDALIARMSGYGAYLTIFTNPKETIPDVIEKIPKKRRRIILNDREAKESVREINRTAQEKVTEIVNKKKDPREVY